MAEKDEPIKKPLILEKDITANFKKNLQKDGIIDGPIEPEAPLVEEPKPKVEEPKKVDEEPKRKKGIFSTPEPKIEEPPKPKVEEPKPKVEDEPPKSQENWQKLKDQHAEELATKDQEISDLRKNAETASANSPEYKKVMEENADMSARLSQLDLANSPEFQKKYTEPAKALREQMAKILKDNEIDEDINKILGMGSTEMRSAISDIIDQLSNLDQGLMRDTYVAYINTQDEAANALVDSEKSIQDINSQNTYDIEAAHSKAWDRLSSSDGKFLSEIDPDDPDNEKDVESAKNYNDGLRAIVERVKLRAQSPRSLEQQAADDIAVETYKFFTTATMDRIEFEFGVRDGRIKKLEATLAGIRKNNPQINGTKADESTQDETPPEQPKTQKEALKIFGDAIRAAPKPIPPKV